MSRLFLIVILSICFNLISSIMVRVNEKKEDYCFDYHVYTKSEIKISYSVASETEEKFSVTCKRNNETLYEKSHVDEKAINHTQNGKMNFTIDDGKVELCFHTFEKKQYFISFDIISSYLNEEISNLGTDEAMKNLLKGVKEIKNVFDELESDLKQKADGKYNHYKVLGSILNSLKFLSYLKISLYLLFSVLQAGIIIKFFGPDKRVSSVTGAFKDGGL